MPPKPPLPKYVQVSERLIREIAAGHLADGSRLPNERAMAHDLDLSVGTLRKALALLTDQGLLVRVQGSGNYICHRPDVQSVYGFFRLERPNGGGLPTASVLDVTLCPKPQDAPAFGASAQGWRIRRLRRIDNVPIAVEEIWLDQGRASRLSADDLSDSLYRHYRDRLGLVITAVEDRIGMRAVPDWAPQDFAVPPGNMAAHISRISRAKDRERAEFSRTWFDHEKARYVSRMGRG